VRPKRFLCPWNILRKSHLSFIEINSLQMDQNELPLDPCHVRVPSGASKMISVHMVRLAQTMHLPCVVITTISKQTHIIHQVRLRRFPCMWYIRCKTVHLSFTEINTFSKWTQISFHLTHITEEFDRVHPK
jgi:hypothetical protein